MVSIERWFGRICYTRLDFALLDWQLSNLQDLIRLITPLDCTLAELRVLMFGVVEVGMLCLFRSFL
jgi:hypothetical protein